ncbi:MAG: class D beta-lactamase [Acidobacteriota bacterium]
MRTTSLCLPFLLCIVPAALYAEGATPDFADLFTEAGVEGTLVVYELETDTTLVHDAERAATRFIPASTFKIPNSFIGLETGVVESPSTIWPWDGTERNLSAWNRDHSLHTAYRNSVVWFYQELARGVGSERMATWLERLDYGNASIDGGIDRFWLDGELRISAHEQIDFLVRLHRDELPFSAKTLALGKEVMVEERTGDHVLRAKTGWALRTPKQLGWYVGYVERPVRAEGGPRTTFFALNIDLEDSAQAAERKRIVRAALARLGVL